MISRRQFFKLTAATGVGLALYAKGPNGTIKIAEAQIPGGTLPPASVPKYVTPMLIPPVMPKAGVIHQMGGKKIDYCADVQGRKYP